MLDKKTTMVLRAMNKLSEDSAYKVITIEEILNSLPNKAYDVDSVKNTIDYLSKQEYIVIKFQEDFTLCYSLLPKARIYLESEVNKGKPKKINLPLSWIVLCGLFSGLVAAFINILFYYLIV